jgi:hypothetical protein
MATKRQKKTVNPLSGIKEEVYRDHNFTDDDLFWVFETAKFALREIPSIFSKEERSTLQEKIESILFRAKEKKP